MKRTSKYVGKEYSGWTVTYIGVATVQAKKKMNGKGAAKRPGHCNYYYLLERVTSDSKAKKQVRLTSGNMCRLARGEFDIEAYSDGLTAKKSNVATKHTAYWNL